MVPWSIVRLALMLQVVAPYVAEMLHLKSLTINRVAGVAGFQSISSCKSNIKSFIINMIACVFGCFSNAPFTPNSEFCTDRFVPGRVARRTASRPSPLGASVSPWLVSNAFRFFGHFDSRKFNHRGPEAPSLCQPTLHA